LRNLQREYKREGEERIEREKRRGQIESGRERETGKLVKY